LFDQDRIRKSGTGNYRKGMSRGGFFMSTVRPIDGNVIPASTNAFSFRKINPAYSGDCVEVRRSSDNATQNIGFASGVLDTGSLSSFVGAGNGFVKTWFNQFGSANLIQTSNSLQPKIVISGTLQTLNSLPTINFDTNAQRLFESELGGVCSRVITSSGDASQIYYVTETTKTAGQILFSVLNSRFNLVSQQSSTDTNVSQLWQRTGFADSGDNYYSMVNGVRTDPYTNRGNVYTKTTGVKIITESNCGFQADQTVGISGFPTPSFSFIGKLSEIIVYTKAFDQFRDRSEITTIQSLINDYYLIY